MNINRETLRLYLQQTRKHRASFITMLLCIPIGAAIIDSGLPYVLSQAIGHIAEQEHLRSLLVAAGGVGLIGVALNYAGFRALTHHEAHVTSALREDTFTKLMEKDNSFFINQKIGAMTSRYIDYVRAYINLQDLLVIRTLGFILTVSSGLIILARESFVVSAIVVAFLLILIVEIRWSAKKRAPLRQERKQLVSDIHGEVADALTNNMVVKSYAGEAREIATVRSLTRRFTVAFKKDIGFLMTEGSVRVLLMVIAQVAAVVVAASLIKNGAMALATAVFMLAYLQRIGSQLFALSDIINGYDQAFLDAQPMTEMLITKNLVDDAPHAPKLQLNTPSIELDNISYAYGDDGRNVIENLKLTIPAGQKIGLVGHSGAGKSTIVQLLLRFSDVTAGRILMSDTDIRSVRQTSLREQIAYVPQEPILFHRTLRENIAYGRPEATDDAIRAGAKRAHALEFIEQLPDGLNTLVGERGVKLSGGQRQRIAIARALLKDAPILILDEATSALDSESEKLIQDSLEELMKGRTSIVIAHRLSTIAKLDRILVLDKGRIVEDGTHAELLKQKGIYAKLWSHQSGGFIED